MRECKEYEITVRQFLRFCHHYTEKIKIHVVFRGEEDFKLKSPRQHDFYLTENASESKEETERLLKYYADVPLWNLHIESKWEPVIGRKGYFICCYLVAHCNYRDIYQGYEQEKKDRQKARRKNENPDSL
jgi:hypothetical protein